MEHKPISGAMDALRAMGVGLAGAMLLVVAALVVSASPASAQGVPLCVITVGGDCFCGTWTSGGTDEGGQADISSDGVTVSGTVTASCRVPDGASPDPAADPSGNNKTGNPGAMGMPAPDGSSGNAPPAPGNAPGPSASVSLPTSTTIGDIAGHSRMDLHNLTALLNFVFWLTAVIFVLLGVLGLKQSTQQGQGAAVMPAIAKFFIAGLAAAAPAVIIWILNTLGASSDALLPTANIGDRAPGIPDGDAVGDTLGHLMQGMALEMKPIEGLFSFLFYIAGIAVLFDAIMKLRGYSDNPRQVPVSMCLKRFFAAALLMAGPWLIWTILTTMGLDLEGHNQDVVQIGDEQVTGLFGLDIMFARFVNNIDGPVRQLVSITCFLLGMLLTASGIMRLIRQEQDGPRGPTAMGTWITFVTAAVLFAFPQVMDAITFSMFADGVGNINPVLAYGVDSQTDIYKSAQRTMEAVFLFAQLVGWVSFIRGFVILRKVADGSSRSSTTAAFTHIIGGALAVNLAPFVRVVQHTVGLPGVLIQ